jgi:hypothetical protein
MASVEENIETLPFITGPVSRLNKAEVIKWLEILDIPYDTTATVLELRAVLTAIKKEQQGSINGDPVKQMAKMRKPQMIKVAGDMGLPLTGNETMGQILIKARAFVNKQKANDPALINAETVVNFGKHRGKSYSVILKNHPDYITWAITTVNEGPDPHHELVKLARWGEYQIVMNGKTEPIKKTEYYSISANSSGSGQARGSSMAKAKANQRAKRASDDEDLGGMGAPVNEEAPEAAKSQTMILHALNAISSRLTSLESRELQRDIKEAEVKSNETGSSFEMA